MTAQDVLNEVDILTTSSDSDDVYEEANNLMYDFISGLHPATMILPQQGLKRK